MVAAVGFRAVGRQGAWWGDAGTLWMEETDTSGGVRYRGREALVAVGAGTTDMEVA